MKPPAIPEILRANTKTIETLKIELLQGRFRPLAYTSERRSRIRELQIENKRLRTQLQVEIQGQLDFQRSANRK